MRFALVLLILFAIPAFAFASILGGPLVFCANPPECQACDLVKTANNIIRFMVAFSVVVATLMFTYAGVLYMSASADPKNIEKAHGIFKAVFVGLVILLVAWLVIDIVMRTLTESKWGPWNEISCQNYPNAGVLARGPGVGYGDQPGPSRTPATAPAGSCAAESAANRSRVTPTGNQELCRDPSTRSGMTPEQRAGTVSRLMADTEVRSAVSQCASRFGLTESQVMSIIAIESGGNRTACDPVRTASGDCITHGLSQMGISDARRVLPELRGKTDAEVRALLRTDVSTSVCAGAAKYREILNNPRYGGDPNLAAAAYNGGSGVNDSASCPGSMQMACPIWDPVSVCNRPGKDTPYVNCFPTCYVTCAYHDQFSGYNNDFQAAGLPGG